MKRHRQLMVATRSDSEEKKRLRVAAEVWWVESQWVIVELVKRRLGWAFVPWHIAASSPAAATLVSPRLAFGDQDWPVAMELVWHSSARSARPPPGCATRAAAALAASRRRGTSSVDYRGAGCGVGCAAGCGACAVSDPLRAPAAAQRGDRRDGRRVLAARDRQRRAFGRVGGGLRGQHIEQPGRAGLVAIVDQRQRLARGTPARRSARWLPAPAGRAAARLVFHLLERAQHGLAIVGHGLVIRRHGLAPWPRRAGHHRTPCRPARRRLDYTRSGKDSQRASVPAVKPARGRRATRW